MDIPGAISLGALEIVFVFLFVDLFDNAGTLVAVGKMAAFFDEANCIPRLNRILISDATATIAGSMAGTSTVMSYIESAAGVVAGGATAPALILVGSMMASHMAEIDWADTVVSIPAFLTIITIPLTFSIANGIAFGFTAFTAMAIVRGEFSRVNWVVCVLTALCVLRFAYLGGY